jgi:hypothetical protein
LTVEDTGSGISPSVLDNIFDPYFSTKGKDKGTGLGLSVVHGIVKSHGGAIHLKSQVGNGTAVQIFLAITDGSDQILWEAEWPVWSTCRGLVTESGSPIPCRKDSGRLCVHPSPIDPPIVIIFIAIMLVPCYY